MSEDIKRPCVFDPLSHCSPIQCLGVQTAAANAAREDLRRTLRWALEGKDEGETEKALENFDLQQPQSPENVEKKLRADRGKRIAYEAPYGIWMGLENFKRCARQRTLELGTVKGL